MPYGHFERMEPLIIGKPARPAGWALPLRRPRSRATGPTHRRVHVIELNEGRPGIVTAIAEPTPTPPHDARRNQAGRSPSLAAVARLLENAGDG